MPADKDRSCWNPILETLPREKLRDLQVKKFRRIMNWASQNSPYHRRIYRAAGIEPGDIKSMEDISRVPTVEKSNMQNIQLKDPFPYGDMLCLPIEEVTAFRQTSGTTGQPVYQADSWQDWEWWADAWAGILYSQGYRASDRVFLPFGYNIFVAFWAAHYGAEKLGCEVIPGGVMNTEQRLQKMRELRATAFMATPTYVLNMAETARNKLGLDPARDFNIKRITCAGEPGASIPATKKRMEDAWGARVFDHIGATETGAWSFECSEQPGGLHVNEALFLVQIEDVQTGEPIEEPNRPGKMIITAFDRQAQPCVRFDSKDIIQWHGDACTCGRTYRMIKGGLIGRSDDITKVKGVLLAPTVIEEAVRGILELSDEYIVTVMKKGDVDDISIQVEILAEAENEQERIIAELADRLREKTNLRFNISCCEYGTLPRSQLKAKRFRDLR
ncbi:MAG: phenylacetate--CoA ligase family protein [Desulfobacteraceae bacterium]|nr:phenylacetate--CoA ligase family protein [Desulfobacteraceae bacterium]